MGQAWINRNPKVIPSLFADQFEYFESPFDLPITKKKDLLRLWRDVPNNQKDINFDFQIISENNNLLIARFECSFTRIKTNIKAYLNGVFFIELDDTGLCTSFNWWWNTKEISVR